MFRAKNESGYSVDIDDAFVNGKYFCPLCDQPVLQRRGEIKVHHFAHYPVSGLRKERTPCCDTWYGTYDMSEWHRNWQKRFDNSFREKVIEKGEEKHIATICAGNLIVEFQHSPISISNFRKRNSFFNELGYRVIWVFDLFDDLQDKALQKWNNKYTWSNVRAPFKSVEIKSVGDALVYVQTNYSETERVLERVTNGYKKFSEFYFDENHVLTIKRFVELVSKGDKTIFEPRKPKVSPDSVNGGDTIFSLWKTNYKWMILENLLNNQFVIIVGKHGRLMYDKHGSGHIMGKYANRNIFTGNLDIEKELKVMWEDNKEVWKFIKCCELESESDTRKKDLIIDTNMGKSEDSLFDEKNNESSPKDSNDSATREESCFSTKTVDLNTVYKQSIKPIMYEKIPDFLLSTDMDERSIAIAEGKEIASLRSILSVTKKSTLIVQDTSELKTYKLSIDRFSKEGYPFEAFLIDENGEITSNETVRVRHRFSMKFWKVIN